MSASGIPNLLSSRGGPRSRGRGRGRGRDGSSQSSPASRQDQTIQATDTDAAISRLSAVSLGYLDDPFAQFFVRGPGTRRLPIINRGTYTRTTALDILINAFLSPSALNPELKQIISLGGGTDTRYFRLRAQNRHQNVIYHEFDFPAVCAAKCHIVESAKALSQNETISRAHNISSISTEGNTTVFQDGEPGWGLIRPAVDRGERSIEKGYTCNPLDLRQLPTMQALDSFRDVRSDLPTLIISECCLCYLEIDVAREVLKWFTDRIPSIGVVLYEPIGVDDAFGQMMVGNLAARGIVMPTVQRYKNLQNQVERLRELGFGADGGGTNAATIEEIWDRWITPEERERVDGLEGLDEIEEWQMLARHYSVVWGWKAGRGWETWQDLQQTNPN